MLGRALEQGAARTPVELACAGRTDAGVHAWGQVVSVRRRAAASIRGGCSRRVNGDARARGRRARRASSSTPDFDARHSAQWRTYRYTIVNRPVPDPFLARYAWWVPEPLDLRALRLGADPFVGEHDFAAFCRKGPEGSTTMRRVLESRWVDVGDGVLRYEIRATAFCWQMVRSIVGTLVDVGHGQRRPGDVMAILRSRDRAPRRPARAAPRPVPLGRRLPRVGPAGRET